MLRPQASIVHFSMRISKNALSMFCSSKLDLGQRFQAPFLEFLKSRTQEQYHCKFELSIFPLIAIPSINTSPQFTERKRKINIHLLATSSGNILWPR